MDVIFSKENVLIKEIRKLKNRKYRDQQNKFFIEGLRFVEEAVKARAKISCIIITESRYESFADFLEYAEGQKIYIVKDILTNDIFDTENPQGIAAIIDREQQKVVESGLFVLLDKLQDPGNVGTIIRTAHAAGASGVLYTSGTVDPFNDKSLRASMGSIFYIPVIQDKNLDYTKQLKNNGYSLVASALDNSTDFYSGTYCSKTIIAVGNEGNGISDEVRGISDKLVRIPMPGGAESLNASIAASIMIYEILRQNL